MKETSCRIIKKTLNFEKNGETLSVEIHLENISPDTKKENIISSLDTIFKSIVDMII